MSTLATPRTGADRLPQSRTAWDLVKKILKPAASLQVTVVLLGLSVVLVFLGTIAQMDDSIHTVLNRYFYTWISWVPVQILFRFTDKFFNIGGNWNTGLYFPFPGGWILGTLLMLNLLAAHTVRFKFTWKRSGIWMIHLGVTLLLLGEFLSSQFKIESRMSIDEGRATNYVNEDHNFELAITDTADPKADAAVVIPHGMLRTGKRISDAAIPVDVEVISFIPVSEITAHPLAENPANKGLGLMQGAQKRKETSGIHPSQKVDLPAAYVRFLDRSNGADLGTYLVSPWFDKVQAVDAGEKTFGVALRQKRRYLPFSLHLVDFRFDKFTGTATAKNFSADVRLLDQEQGVDRSVRIAMNEPLRYRGETFYQSSWDPDTETTTILQVVRNPAWTTPYLACTLVSLGMMLHFGIHLAGFRNRRAPR